MKSLKGSRRISMVETQHTKQFVVVSKAQHASGLRNQACENRLRGEGVKEIIGSTQVHWLPCPNQCLNT